MIAMKAVEVDEVKVGSVDYKGRTADAKEVGIRWLSKVGMDSVGGPAYGLRLITIGPDGEIPIHKHSYEQTMYFVTGEFECFAYDPETDEVMESKICEPGDMAYVPSMEPHGMRNTSGTETGTFLCCICTLDAPTACSG